MIDYKIKDKFAKIRMLYRYIIIPRMAKLSDHIITVSENSKKDIIDICKVDEKKISVIHDAVSSNFQIDETEERKLNYDYFLYVGTVDHPGKNIHNSILAFQKFKKKSKSNIRFVICGIPGKGFDIINNLIEKSHYREHINYLGYVSDRELFNYYKFAKVFVFISYYEGFGLPVLEAMKFGVPVITSDRSSLPEVVDNAAIICNPDDIDEICTAYKNITEDIELRNTLINRGYSNLKRFSWEKTAKQTFEVFKILMGQ